MSAWKYVVQEVFGSCAEASPNHTRTVAVDPALEDQPLVDVERKIEKGS